MHVTAGFAVGSTDMLVQVFGRDVVLAELTCTAAIYWTVEKVPNLILSATISLQVSRHCDFVVVPNVFPNS